jgi:hypothetical protein
MVLSGGDSGSGGSMVGSGGWAVAVDLFCCLSRILSRVVVDTVIILNVIVDH